MMPYMVITVVSNSPLHSYTCTNPNHWAEGIATYQVDHKWADSEIPPYELHTDHSEYQVPYNSACA